MLLIFPILVWQKWTKFWTNVLDFTLVFSYLLSQRLVKVVTTLLLELSFVLVRLSVRYLNCSLPNPSLCARQTGSSSKSYRTM